MKRLNKAAAVMIAAAVVATTAPAANLMMPVYAAQEQAQQMETAIKAVKTKIDIPADFSKFSSDTMRDEENTVYSLNWSKEDGSGNIYVQCDARGNISSYRIYTDGSNESTLNISKEEALQTAEAFLRKAAPERFADENDCLVLVNDLKAGDLNRYYFSYVRKHQGIEVLDNSASVSVLVKDGKAVVSYANIDWTDGSFSGNAEISLEDARTVYTEKFPMELHYHATYGKDKKYIMSYSFNDSERFLNAENGEKAELFRQGRFLVSGGGGALKDAAVAEAKANYNAALTPEEQAEIENYEDMEAVETVKAKIFAIPELNLDKNSKITDTFVRKDTDNNIYYLRVSCKNGDDRYFSFTTDAKTGELYQFNRGVEYDSRDIDDKKELTEQEKTAAQEKVEAFIKAQNPDKFSQLRLEDVSAYGKCAEYHYVRMVNGIPLQNDTINAVWNTQENMIQGYHVNWTSQLPDSLPDPSKAISAQTATDALYQKHPLKYQYILTEKGTYSLCIAMEDAVWELVDGLTGKIIKYDGSEAGEDYTPVEYTDLDGHWAKTAAEALASVGIGLPGTEFKADEAITQADLLYMLLCVRGQYVYNEVSYDDIYRRGSAIIPEAEQEPEAQVTREKAVKYMLVNGEYDKAAQIPGIFKTGFADEAQISEDCLGYVAIAKGLGMISGTGDGFAPQDSITRGQAAVMLYQYLMK